MTRRPAYRTVGHGPRAVELTIESLAAGGDGVGRDQAGRVTFVARTTPGDRVRAVLIEEHRAWARAELAAVVAPSAERRVAPCPYFVSGVCGGCQWQQVSPDAQGAAKQEIVAGALRRLVAAGMELLPIAAPTPGYGWRRRARLHWYRGGGEPAAVIGFLGPRSHRVADIEHCLQLEPALDAALAALREGLGPVLRGRGAIAMLAGEGGAVHLAIEPEGGECDVAAAERLVGRAGIAGVTVGGVDLGAPYVLLERGALLSGTADGADGGLPMYGRADWFAQASLAGNRALLAAIDAAAGPRQGASVVEFFAGSGNFTRLLARGARSLVATDLDAPPWPLPIVVDGVGDGVGDGGGVDGGDRGGDGDARIELRYGAADEVASALLAEGRRFDLAVLDPPRAGAPALFEPLVALRPRRIVYVSCDPATLARDLGRLGAAGYRAEGAQAFDLMPQTAHVEVVATAVWDGEPTP